MMAGVDSGAGVSDVASLTNLVNRKRGREDVVSADAGFSEAQGDGRHEEPAPFAGANGVMKRQASSGGAAGTPSMTTTLISVPREAVGYIIGKGGETIKEMNARSGAHVEVEKEDPGLLSSGSAPPMRSFHVTGSNSQIEVAKMLVAEKVATVLQSRATISGGGALSTAASDPGLTPNFEIWVPADRVGMVIGSGGAVIKQLQEKSGALVVVHNDRVDAHGQKLVTITGGASEASTAKKLVTDIMRKPKPNGSASVPGPSIAFNGTSVPLQRFSGFNVGFVGPQPGAGVSTGLGASPVQETKIVRIPTSCVGIVIGKRGETIRDLQMRSGAHVKVTPDSESPKDAHDRVITITGARSAVDLAHTMLNDLVNEGLQRHGGRGSIQPNGRPFNIIPATVPPPPTADLTSPDSTHRVLQAASIVVELAVSSDKVGLVIGKGGNTIRELQQRSGARIVVAKENSIQPPNTRQVTVTGPPPFVEAAKSMISEKVSSHHVSSTSQAAMQGGNIAGVASCGVYPSYTTAPANFGLPGSMSQVYPGAYTGQYTLNDQMAYYTAYAQASMAAQGGNSSVEQAVRDALKASKVSLAKPEPR